MGLDFEWLFKVVLDYFGVRNGDRQSNEPTPIPQLRLAIQAILFTDPLGFVLWLGTLCSTWSAVSRGSTFRNWLDPYGDLSKKCVTDGNLMVSRRGLSNPTYGYIPKYHFRKPICSIDLNVSFFPWFPCLFRSALLMALTVCMGGRYILEQPLQSLMPRHKRIRWLMEISNVPWTVQICFSLRVRFLLFKPERTSHGIYGHEILCWKSTLRHSENDFVRKETFPCPFFGARNWGFPSILVHAPLWTFQPKATHVLVEFPMGG